MQSEEKTTKKRAFRKKPAQNKEALAKKEETNKTEVKKKPAKKKTSAVNQKKPAESTKKKAQVKQEAVMEQAKKTPQKKKPAAKKLDPNEKFKIIPLGGLGEVGKNMTVIEYRGKMIIIDCGMTFPDDDMLGIDYVIPDTTYLEQNRDKLLGIFLTHGHEDHIGALPYVLKDFNLPVYGTKLTLGIVFNKLKEHKLDKTANLIEQKAGDVVDIEPFKVEFIAVNHSIADAVAFAITTPCGTIVHTGDFKMDMTPIMGDPIDLPRLGELGRQGVLALLSESTNAERPGFASSERHVGQTFETIFQQNPDRRIIVATFSSNVHRVQQVINSAVNTGRKVAISGRSMVNVIAVARELGYISVPEGTIVDLNDINKYPQEKMVIVTTGSQGEPMSALYRMAYSDHKKVEITSNDLVIISANAIPGNEKLVYRIINELMKSGADVVYSSAEDVHVSGHACQEELSMMLSLIKPKFFFPIHGEYRHQKHHAALAKFTGVAPENIFIMENGNVAEVSQSSAKITGKVPAGKVFVDGLGVGDVGNIVLRDRRHLAQDGLIVVVATFSSDSGLLLSGPDLISRGFVYVREATDIMDGAREVVMRVMEKCQDNNVTDWTLIKGQVKDALTKYIFDKTKRNPMILPVIMEV